MNTSSFAARWDKAAAAAARKSANPPYSILVVDDEPAIRDLCAAALSRSGCYVDVAEDGAAAWDTMQMNSYDLLVTDHSMPNVSGVELLQKLHAARMALPAIMVSGAMPTEELNRRPWLQIDARLLKPFTTDELLATVRKVLSATDGARGQIAPARNWQNQPSAYGWQLG
jgi:two-component system OmpR family response regulator